MGEPGGRGPASCRGLPRALDRVPGTLAIDEEATAELGDGALLRLERLGERIAGMDTSGAEPRYTAHVRRAAREIRRYPELGEVLALRTGVIRIPLPWP